MNNSTRNLQDAYQEWVLQLFDEAPDRFKGELTPAEIQDGLSYFEFHQRRFAYLVDVLAEVKASDAPGGTSSALDIGPSYFTLALSEVLGLDVTALDFHPQLRGLGAAVGIDLVVHDLCDPDIPLADGSFDLILFSEVIEHIPKHPGAILDEFNRLLKPGGILIVQTPNFANLSNRLHLLMGHNVQEEYPPPGDDFLPGHFREYCMNELLVLLAKSGFDVVRAEYCTYWDRVDPRVAKQRLRGRFLRVFPSLRSGITIVARRRGATSAV